MTKNTFWINIIYIVSVAISLTVAFLILGPRPEGIEGLIDVSFLPLVNASLNGITALLLVVGVMLIKLNKINAHKLLMLSAFSTSTLFLLSYVVYHWFKSGPKPYLGDSQGVYYFILITHIILAMIIIPLALFTLYHAWVSDFKKHKKIAKITFPVWLYVSATGVLIYFMLYP
mgnify:FL=1